MARILLSTIKLLITALLAIYIDILFYAFTKTCASCGSFQAYLSSAHSLFTPTWASLVLLVQSHRKK